MFNFLSKPVIFVDNDSSQKNDTREKERRHSLFINLKKNQDDEKIRLKELINYFEDKKNRSALSEIDKRLLKNLDEDIENFMENSAS